MSGTSESGQGARTWARIGAPGKEDLRGAGRVPERATSPPVLGLPMVPGPRRGVGSAPRAWLVVRAKPDGTRPWRQLDALTARRAARPILGGAPRGSVAKFDFWAKSKNWVSGMQGLTDPQTLEKATLRQNRALSLRHPVCWPGGGLLSYDHLSLASSPVRCSSPTGSSGAVAALECLKMRDHSRSEKYPRARRAARGRGREPHPGHPVAWC
jgi:hypothetical protein